jgi:hypothetical protein
MTRRNKPIVNEETDSKPVSKKDLIGKIIKKKPKEKFLTENQRKYFEILKQTHQQSTFKSVAKNFV